MNAQESAESFPASIPLPRELRALCDWLETNGYPISGAFELRKHEVETICLWFGSERAVGHLAQFGAGSDGCLYCIWRQGDGRSPIVHMGSEGQDNVVLASDALGFLRLLAIGYEDIGDADFSSPPEPDCANPAFQAWVSETYGVTIPKTGSEITLTAQETHGDFQSWITPAAGDGDCH